jgi:hypothetical protein
LFLQKAAKGQALKPNHSITFRVGFKPKQEASKEPKGSNAMEAQYRTLSGRLTVRVEGKDHKELFRALAESQEIFDSESKCGCCQSESLRFTVRTREGNDYYKLVCADCAATFDFGQTKQGARLYPKRRGKDEKPLPNGGWAQWGRDPESGI